MDQMTPRLRGTNLLTDIEAGELAELAHWFQTELTAMISILDRLLTGPNRCCDI